MDIYSANGVRIIVKQVQRASGYSYRFRPMENEIYLNVPYGTSVKTLSTYATSLVKKGREEQRLNDYSDGGFMHLFGEKVPLAVRQGASASIEENDEGVTLTLSNGIDYFATKKIKDFYSKKLKEYLKKRVPVLENYVGLKCSSWKVENRLSVWGCCNTQTKAITFCANLATQSPESIDYVIIHELAHILYPDHGPKFHAFLEKYVPGHREIAKRLKN